MVFQNMALFPHRSVRDNVAFGLEVRNVAKDLRRKVAEEKLAIVNLDGWEDRFPSELSGGMQQRVGLARALAADPDILLMDEPFSALDPLIRRQLQDQFIELSKVMNKTSLFITHDLDEAIRLGHRIAIMKDGVLVQIGTPEHIITEPAFGASPRQLLFKVELPLAVPSIMTGINQTIMMSLSMVVVAALIGAGGLGYDVLFALQHVEAGKGILAGIAIVFCAMILDRIIQGSREKEGRRMIG